MSRITRILLMVLTVVALAGGIIGPVQEASAATHLYGRDEWELYFSGGYTSGSWPCSGGQLICNGITVTEIEGFVTFYRDNLNSGDVHSRSGAAFTILVMLGVDGPTAGGNSGNRVANGVQMARNRFAEWEATVRSYAAAGSINFSENYRYQTNTAYRDQPLWHNEASVRVDESIVFTLPNGSQVAIKKACANLVGDWSGLPAVANYSLSAGSSVTPTTATPGDRVTWSHSLTNNGPTATSQNTHSNIGLSGFTNGWTSPVGDADDGAGAGVGVMRSNWGYHLYDVTQGDVGNTLCEWVQYDPTGSGGGRDGRGNHACVDVPYNYNLTPEISNITNGDMIESAQGLVSVNGRVTNAGPTKSVLNIDWQVTQIEYAKGAPLPNSGGGSSGSNPCAYFTGYTNCASISSGTEGAGYGYPDTKAYLADGNLADKPVGTRLCYAMSVNPGSTATGNWKHSQLYCLVVGKRPKIQVYGGDLIVGRGYNSAGGKISANVITSVSNKNGTYYGSWGEYAIIPSGKVTGMASASGYAGGVSSKDLCGISTPLSLLTFSNATSPSAPSAGAGTCNSNNIGYYSLTSASQFDAVTSRFAVNSPRVLTGAIDIMDPNPTKVLNSQTIYSADASISLSSSSQIPAGKWVVINAPNTDVRITSNINYTNAVLTSVSDIPQLVIIAKNITIQDNVTNVDAWLFAKGTGNDGTINTCDRVGSNEPTDLTSEICNSMLTINGPVVANHLNLYRTSGSDVGTASGNPAEVFNLRPDAYMWANNLSGIGIKARTATVTELPPRF